MTPKRIENCRICGHRDLVNVVDLGEHALTGVFPHRTSEHITTGPLRLLKCAGECGLLQLEHTYDLTELYGANYGYRSGLNASMVTHLKRKVQSILDRAVLKDGDVVLDIGSNDATTLKAFPSNGLRLVGIDPTGPKFHHYYPPHLELISEFFSADLVRHHVASGKVRVVTSIAMFYDLEQPLKFMQDVHRLLTDDGIWVSEQSYMPRMLEVNSYDTICHEHLEYYGVIQLKWMADRVGFRIIDIEMNDINGGSFSVTFAKKSANYADAANLAALLAEERARGLQTVEPYLAFAKRTEHSRRELRGFVETAKATGKTLYGLGASTKGNVILQYCGITSTDLPLIGEVNSDKFGCFTPGTLIPIGTEEAVLKAKPDYLLVLPWHFRRFFENNPKFRATKLVFPLPHLEIIGAS